jgi:hypothetical protein
MKTWTAAAIVALALAFSGATAMSAPAQAAEPAAATVASPKVTDVSARHRYRHYRRYGYHPYYQPYYYARPSYYQPYPYAVPLPFFLGFGFGPLW